MNPVCLNQPAYTLKNVSLMLNGERILHRLNLTIEWGDEWPSLALVELERVLY